MMRTKTRKKSSRMHGKGMGTHGGGARKKRKGSGHRGGKGMSGSGKRADHKKTLVTKKSISIIRVIIEFYPFPFFASNVI